MCFRTSAPDGPLWPLTPYPTELLSCFVSFCFMFHPMCPCAAYPFCFTQIDHTPQSCLISAKWKQRKYLSIAHAWKLTCGDSVWKCLEILPSIPVWNSARIGFRPLVERLLRNGGNGHASESTATLPVDVRANSSPECESSAEQIPS